MTETNSLTGNAESIPAAADGSNPQAPNNLTKQPDFEAVRTFLHLLGKPPGTSRLRGFYPAGHPAKANDSGRKSPPTRRTVEQWQAEGRGVYVVINDGGDTDAEITACRAFFCEWDDRPKEWQINAWQNLGLPEPTLQVDTGGKSIHNYWVLADPITPQHWKIVQTRLLEHADADRSLKNPSRVMRLPGTYHVNNDGTLGAQTSIIHQSDRLYSITDIEACLPDEDTYDHITKAQRFTDYNKHSINEIRDALACIPPRVPGSNTYAMYRNILWGLIAACIEAGGTPDQAIALMQAHSPQWQGIAQIAKSGGEHIKVGTFWYWAHEHGWRPTLLVKRMKRTKLIDAKTGEITEIVTTRFESKNADYLPEVEKDVFGFPKDRWICSDNLLYKWTGTHYEHQPDEKLTPQIANFLAQLEYKERKDAEPIHPWARPRYVAESLAWMRAKLGTTEVNPHNAINCKNGVVEWNWEGNTLSWHLLPHDPDFHFTYITDYNYDPEANTEQLERLLAAVEPTDIDTLQRILGSGMDLAKYRSVRGRPRALLMIGGGSNGKDTIRTALRDTLGARNFSSCTLADFRQYDQGRKFPIAPLRDAAINWSSENSQFVHIDSLQALKSAISGEELAWEIKGVQEATFVPNALFVFNLNKEPSLSGEQAAIETRFHVFQFRKTFLTKPTRADHLKADPRLKDDPHFIQKHICPAFLNWLLEGLKLAVEHGIDYDSGKEAMRSVRRKGCHLWDFCDEVGLEWDANHSVPHAIVWQKLCDWYTAEGFRDLNGRWVIDPANDPTIKASRLLVPKLLTIFPDLRSEKDPETRSVMLVGLKLPKAWER
jgi:hypothetical protein